MIWDFSSFHWTSYVSDLVIDFRERKKVLFLKAQGPRAAFFIHTQQKDVAIFPQQNLSVAPYMLNFSSTCRKMMWWSLRDCIRMDKMHFDYLVERLYPYPIKQDTIVRESIKSSEQCCLFLRYAPSGEIFRSLTFCFINFGSTGDQ